MAIEHIILGLLQEPLSGYDLYPTPPKRENWFRNHRRRLAKDQKQRKATEASIKASEPYEEE